MNDLELHLLILTHMVVGGCDYILHMYYLCIDRRCYNFDFYFFFRSSPKKVVSVLG